MQVNVENVGPCEAKVSFTVPGAEFESQVQKALKHHARHMRVKGFRPGKVPTNMVEREHGPRVRLEAKNHFLQEAYRKAIEDNDLQPIGFTRPREEDLELERGEDFSHEFAVSLRPQFELKEYKGITLESELEPTLDEEVEQTLAGLKRQHANPEELPEDEGLPEDGMGLGKLSWFHGDEEILTREGLRLVPQGPPPGVDPAAFAKQLEGSKAGSGLDLELTIPPDFEREELRGKSGRCHIALSQVFRMREPSTQEVLDLLGIEDSEAIPGEVRRRIEAAKRQAEDQRIEQALIAELCERHPMELPKTMVQQQAEARMNQLRQEIAQQGAPEEEIEKLLSDQEENARERAKRGMQALFLIQAIAEKEELLVSEEELATELKVIAERNQATLEEVRDYYQKNNLVEQMALEILERKVRTFLRDSADIQES